MVALAAALMAAVVAVLETGGEPRGERGARGAERGRGERIWATRPARCCWLLVGVDVGPADPAAAYAAVPPVLVEDVVVEAVSLDLEFLSVMAMSTAESTEG